MSPAAPKFQWKGSEFQRQTLKMKCIAIRNEIHIVHVHSRFAADALFYRRRNLRFLVMKKMPKKVINKWKKFRCRTGACKCCLNDKLSSRPNAFLIVFFFSSFLNRHIFITTKAETNVHATNTTKKLNRDSVCWLFGCVNAVDAARTTTNVSMHVARIRLATYLVSRGYIVYK